MQAWRTFVVLLLAVLFQVALGRLLRPPWSVPFDLFVILTVFYSGATSRFWATVLGAAIGIMGDALSPTLVVGRQAFALALVGWAVSGFNELFVISAGFMKMLAVFGATVIVKTTVYGLDVLLQQGSATLSLADVARESTVNALVAPFVMAALARWHRGGGAAPR